MEVIQRLQPWEPNHQEVRAAVVWRCCAVTHVGISQCGGRVSAADGQHWAARSEAALTACTWHGTAWHSMVWHGRAWHSHGWTLKSGSQLSDVRC